MTRVTLVVHKTRTTTATWQQAMKWARLLAPVRELLSCEGVHTRSQQLVMFLIEVLATLAMNTKLEPPRRTPSRQEIEGTLETLQTHMATQQEVTTSMLSESLAPVTELLSSKGVHMRGQLVMFEVGVPVTVEMNMALGLPMWTTPPGEMGTKLTVKTPVLLTHTAVLQTHRKVARQEVTTRAWWPASLAPVQVLTTSALQRTRATSPTLILPTDEMGIEEMMETVAMSVHTAELEQQLKLAR